MSGDILVPAISAGEGYCEPCAQVTDWSWSIYHKPEAWICSRCLGAARLADGTLSTWNDGPGGSDVQAPG
jgi:hypothetical protein